MRFSDLNHFEEEKHIPNSEPRYTDNFIRQSPVEMMDPHSYEWKNSAQRSPVSKFNHNIELPSQPHIKEEMKIDVSKA